MRVNRRWLAAARELSGDDKLLPVRQHEHSVLQRKLSTSSQITVYSARGSRDVFRRILSFSNTGLTLHATLQEAGNGHPPLPSLWPWTRTQTCTQHALQHHCIPPRGAAYLCRNYMHVHTVCKEKARMPWPVFSQTIAQTQPWWEGDSMALVSVWPCFPPSTQTGRGWTATFGLHQSNLIDDFFWPNGPSLSAVRGWHSTSPTSWKGSGCDQPDITVLKWSLIKAVGITKHQSNCTECWLTHLDKPNCSPTKKFTTIKFNNFWNFFEA